MDDGHDLPRERVRASFARAAATYDAAAALQREVLARLLERLDEAAGAPAVILDAGAGTGNGAAVLAERHPRARVVALDLAETMATRASQRKRWRRDLFGVCGDAERLPLRDASVDIVFSNLMLQWLPTPDTAFAEFRRVLKPHGVLLFATFGPDTLMELRDAWAAADDGIHVNRFIDMHDVGDALLRLGFRDPVMDAERMTVTYPDTLALMHDLKAIGAHNMNAGRARGLMGRHRFAAMQAAYEAKRVSGVLPSTWEIVFGRALAPPPGLSVSRTPGESRVSAASIGIRRR